MTDTTVGTMRATFIAKEVPLHPISSSKSRWKKLTTLHHSKLARISPPFPLNRSNTKPYNFNFDIQPPSSISIVDVRSRCHRNLKAGADPKVAVMAIVAGVGVVATGIVMGAPYIAPVAAPLAGIVAATSQAAIAVLSKKEK